MGDRDRLRGTRGRYVDEGTVMELTVAAGRLAQWDAVVGVTPAYVATVERQTLAALERQCPSQLRADLYAVVGDIFHTTGYMAFDRGDLGASRSAYADTLDIAGEAGGGLELSLAHRARLSMARTHLTRYRDNSLRPHAALEWATGGEDGRLTVGERALAWQVRARAHAVMGQSQATTRAVGQATEVRAAASPGNDPPWVAVSGEAEFLGDSGHALADLALAASDAPTEIVREADVRLLAAAQDPEAHHRTRLFSRLAAAALSMRYVDPARAVEIAAPALRMAPLAASAQATVLAGQLRRECRRHLHNPDVRWLDDQLGAISDSGGPGSELAGRNGLAGQADQAEGDRRVGTVRSCGHQDWKRNQSTTARSPSGARAPC